MARHVNIMSITRSKRKEKKKMLKLVYDTQTTEKGEVYTHYFIELSNGYRIQVKPSFKEDYKKLRLIAEKAE